MNNSAHAFVLGSEFSGPIISLYAMKGKRNLDFSVASGERSRDIDT